MVKPNGITSADCEVLFQSASPELYRVNAFRVLGLPVDATTKQVNREAQKIAMRMRVGFDDGGSASILGLSPAPGEEAVKGAVQRLKEPEVRLVDEVFWFWPLGPGESDDDPALSALRRGDFQEAVAVWTEHEKAQSESMVSAHNLAVLGHLMALDIEHAGSNGALTDKQRAQKLSYWKQAYSRWKRCFEYDGLWQRLNARVRELDDPRVTTGMVRRFRAALPVALLCINARLALHAAEGGDKREAQQHIELMRGSGFDGGFAAEALRLICAPLRERIKILCEAAEAETSRSPENGDKAIRRLIEQTAQPVAVIDILLPDSDPTREAVHDELALRVLHSQIAFGKKTENWAESVKLLDLGLSVVASSSARQRIEENLKIVKDNLALGTCWFCGTRSSDDAAEIEVKMYGNVTRTPIYNGTRIEWQNITVRVPRCSNCKSAHGKVGTHIGVGCLFGLMAGGLAWAGIAAAGSPFWGFVAFAICGIAGAGIASSRGERKFLQGIKPEGTKTQYSTVAKLKSEGWVIGDRPTS